MEYRDAKKILCDRINLIDAIEVDIEEAYDKILSEDLISNRNVPEFNRSPLDGYCFNCEDTLSASLDNPIYFDIIEEVACGSVAKKSINKNQTIKILTGAKMPDGANCVIRYEDIEIENGKLKLCYELSENQNVILAGEDIKKDTAFAKCGTKVDIGIVGILAALGIKKIKVFDKIKVGFISTGSELLEVGEELSAHDGKIYNSNRYVFDGILKKQGIDCNYYGIVEDNIEKLKNMYDKALNENDIVISTGGVSVGDYDYVKRALNDLNLDIFIDNIEMKPGMACCFAQKNKKFVFALSGNPMSSVTTFYAVCLPAIKKMMGYKNYENEFLKVRLNNSFNKKIGKVRFLRGKLKIVDGVATAFLNLDQGNIVIKSLIDCNIMLMVENGEEVVKGNFYNAVLI